MMRDAGIFRRHAMLDSRMPTYGDEALMRDAFSADWPHAAAAARSAVRPLAREHMQSRRGDALAREHAAASFSRPPFLAIRQFFNASILPFPSATATVTCRTRHV